MAESPKLAFTKIRTRDVEGLAAFYAKAFGRVEKLRFRTEDNGDPLEEIVLAAPNGEGQSLVLIDYPTRPQPVPGEVLVGFVVADVRAAVEAVVAAGGTVEQPPAEQPEMKVLYSYVLDPEGHRLEIVQYLSEEGGAARGEDTQ